MNICIIGTGFVGVVSAAVYASFGNKVIGLDIDPQKIEKLKQGEVPFFEPGLTELLLEQQKSNNLQFTTDYQTAISDSEIIFVAVGTPSAADGQADLKYVFATADSMAPFLKDGAIIVIKSTVPPGTLNSFAERVTAKTKVSFSMASVPEFLREGTAVNDTLHPDRVVIGATDRAVSAKLSKLHEPLQSEIILMSPESAQMAKYSANAYLATRITFINQIADLCEKNGADVQQVIEAIGFDKRIGPQYWYPGMGYGGSCFPKDVKELAAYSKSVGESNNLLIKINEINEARIEKLLSQYETAVGGWSNKKVAILGLSFKPNTNDMREAPSVKVVPVLLSKGAKVFGYDPKAEWPANGDVSFYTASPITAPAAPESQFTQTATLLEAVSDADVTIVLIEWPEITSFDFATVKSQKPQWFIDTRDQFDPKQIQTAGYTYIGVGR